MSCKPLISVLMPVRNEERFLPAALDSLFRQTLADWELVAVDDGSSDATPAILAAAAKGDPRVRVLRREGGGLVAALNAGLELCRAPLLARMDGDDVSHPRRLATQADCLSENPHVGLVASSFRHFPRQGLRRGMLDYERWQNSLTAHELIVRDLFVESPFVHPGVMTRREIVAGLGGYRDLGWPEDYDLWLRMAAAGTRFARLPGPVFCWRDHPERATRTMSEYAQDAMRRCKLHHLQQAFLEEVSELVLAGAGQEARAWQRLLAAAGIRVSHWLDVDPRKIGRLLHGAPVLHSESFELEQRKMLVAIGLRGARDQFRQTAARRGWTEGADFVCVA
ncbi:glycosyltransferase family 2 protein [Geomesophilobacter sediminis]|uniref:Glycosyltransferase n=1 Tax=Geomesophilobacter sediminis TaxID=2798584 RepID=A0A8J7LTG0_9BACT|nr:glycosyltransferase [Geomesophilobacter sediminis]MBJ6723374.1 glycosyltransferase [Geomesophilobacter sediminis]